ncbi:MAG: [acyl-carrier-protein] S-malonyltransferase [Candidatus Glassbacteria bacterium RBG_16_58_8]|uniref:Malonyl CoA-acyl carrier protein transacylase n=1 Tax=Candidatus Glassbacteria bacterium RBG_16_58_8 TaxID=1817866 RepID=A0A1F5YCA0_9BACT|nr:MAG: [acyl-carrier-protein] S-malonyltransferase [Candidatus Glassbacteria bacterium RBG_16_58_8]
MGGLAFLFPGQGSQYVGMGKTFYDRYPAAKEVFDEADDCLGFALSRIVFEGPEGELVQTRNTQPAIMAFSVALMRILEAEGIAPGIAAGHSLGEYSALVCAGSLSFMEALRTVRLRGELMYEAGLREPGTMAAVLGMEPREVEKVCREASAHGIVEPANYNSPEQTVISGDLKAVKAAMQLARERGAKRVISLEVSGAFHSSLMQEALPGLETHLDKIEIGEARIPVVANVDARDVRDGEGIRRRLKEQLMRPVRWSDSIRHIAGFGCELFVEVGPGKGLSRLLKKIDGNLKGISLDDIDTFESFRHSPLADEFWAQR